jgi:hypothetical protein
VKKLPCLEAHSIPYSQKKFQKITAILDASSSVTKSPKTHFGAKRALGVNSLFRFSLTGAHSNGSVAIEQPLTKHNYALNQRSMARPTGAMRNALLQRHTQKETSKDTAKNYPIFSLTSGCRLFDPFLAGLIKSNTLFDGLFTAMEK